MELRQYLRALRKYWWVIVIPTLVGSVIGVVMVSREVPQYRGAMTYFVRTVGETNANSQFAGDQFAQRRVNSYVGLLSTDRLANSIVERTGLEIDPGEVAGMISASGNVNTVLLTVNVTGTSEETVAAVSEALAVEFVNLVNQVENSGQMAAGVNVELVSGPSVSQVPSRPIMTVGPYGALGLAVGLAFALLLELRDTSVRTEEQVEQLGAAPVLARIPMDRSARDSPLITSDRSDSARAEAFRQLRTNLQFIDVERTVQVLVVTSSVPDEGKSSTTANLALALAAAQRRVLVIEADLRRPKVADYFGMERASGLTDVLVGRADVANVLQPWDERLMVLPCGQVPPNPSELLGSATMAKLLESLRKQFDHIIIDTPPLLPVTDGAVVATRADGVVLVIRSGRTTRQQVSMSLRSLDAVGAATLGSVLTMTAPKRGSAYDTYRYGAAEQAPPSAPDGPPRQPAGEVPAGTTPAWGDRQVARPVPPLPRPKTH
jgi:capsular exopolysaccharide synthesis family protein